MTMAKRQLGLTCACCLRPFRGSLARRTEDGFVHATGCPPLRQKLRKADAAARLEDLEWMAAGGEGTEGAARRLGVGLDALDRWCYRNARDVWRRLRENDPRDHNRRTTWADERVSA